MNASDVINAVGASPGTLTTLSGASSYSYVATVTSLLIVTGAIGGGSLSIGGVAVFKTGGVDSFQISVPVAKGQTVVVALVSGGTPPAALLSARSIQ